MRKPAELTLDVEEQAASALADLKPGDRVTDQVEAGGRLLVTRIAASRVGARPAAKP